MTKECPPQIGSKEYVKYIKDLKAKISKEHNELIEVLKNEEKISREIQKKKS